jgi:hypothetical protein
MVMDQVSIWESKSDSRQVRVIHPPRGNFSRIDRYFQGQYRGSLAMTESEVMVDLVKYRPVDERIRRYA